MDNFTREMVLGNWNASCRERWDTVALQHQIETLDALIAADLESVGKHSGYPVAGREDHPLEPILAYLRRTLERCGGAPQ